MLTTTMIILLLIGVVLCFFGYRFFRAAMGLCGLVLGGIIGDFVYQLTANFLPSVGTGLWMYVFIIVGAVLFALLSFKIYKSALFYVSMLFTSLVLLQSYLSVTKQGGLTAFFLALFNKTPLGEASSSLAGATLFGDTSAGSLVADSVTLLSGDKSNLWIALGVCILVGILVGVLVCIFQRPAIILVTSIYGAILVVQGVFPFFAENMSGGMGEIESLTTTLFQGANPTLEVLAVMILAGLGLLVQFKKTAKKDK